MNVVESALEAFVLYPKLTNRHFISSYATLHTSFKSLKEQYDASQGMLTEALEELREARKSTRDGMKGAFLGLTRLRNHDLCFLPLPRNMFLSHFRIRLHSSINSRFRC
jgi:hypothetical protein